MMMQDDEPASFWGSSPAELLAQLQTSPQGLSAEQAQQRLQQFGANTNRLVAASVGARIGLKNEEILTGPELRRISPEALQAGGMSIRYWNPTLPARSGAASASGCLESWTWWPCWARISLIFSL
jgi:hypothetical protein